MQYRQLGMTDLDVSEVGFGLWALSSELERKVERSDAVHLLQQASELGITFFDTSDSLNQGYGEEIISRALSNQRHRIIIGTKFGYDTQAPNMGEYYPRPQRWDPEFVRKACESSLRRMKTDYIDLYQLHDPPIQAIQDHQVFETLDSLVKEGKVRFYGVSLGLNNGQWAAGQEAMQVRNIASVQLAYNIIEQQPGRSLFPIANGNRVGLLIKSPHASEILTDQFNNKSRLEFASSKYQASPNREWLSRVYEYRQKVLIALREAAGTLTETAIQFCLADKTVASVLPNIGKLSELEEYVNGSDTIPLSSTELNELRRLYDEEFHRSEVTETPGD